MKKVLTSLFLFVLVISTALFVISCKKGNQNDSTGGDSGSQPEIELTLSDKSVGVLFGESYLITADYTRAQNLTLVWSTENDKVATVKDGLVTAVGKGSTKIIATYGSKEAECEVSVNFGDYMPELKIRHMSENGARISLNSTFDIDAYILFNGKEYDCEFDAEIANCDVLSYKNGAITANALGSTTVTIKTDWNGFDNALTEKTFDVEVFHDVKNQCSCYRRRRYECDEIA